MAEILAPGVFTQEESPKVRTINGEPTATAGFTVVTEKGPLGVDEPTTTFDEWVRIYGRAIAASKSFAHVEQFYNNGGTKLYTNRIVHYTDVTNPATKISAKGTVDIDTTTGNTQGTVLGTATENFDLEPNDTLDVAVDGGGATTATFTATAAARTSGAETYALNNNDTLLVAIDGGSVQTITFLTGEFSNIALATALEVAAVINAKSVGLSATVAGGMVTITSDRRGSGSGVNVSGGTGNAALGFTTGLISGTGNVSNIDAVTAAEVKTVVEAAVAGVTVSSVAGAIQIVTDTVGSTGDVQVDAASTADTIMGLDNAVHAGTDSGAATALTIEGKYDGAYANGLQAVISNATNGIAEQFNLTIVESGVTLDVFPNLVNDNASLNDVSAVVNNVSGGSNWVAAVFVLSGRPTNGTYALLAGDDGLTGLANTDYIGSSAGGTGFFGFDGVNDIRVLVAPDRTDSAVQAALFDYASITREKSMFSIPSIPLGLTTNGAITYVKTTAALKNRGEVGAVYWPNPLIPNPNKVAYGSTENITIQVSALMAGLYARTDGSRIGGIYDEPAGTERGLLRGIVGLESSETQQRGKRNLLYPENINPLWKPNGTPIIVDGSRILDRTQNFPSVSQRRGVIFMEQSIEDGLLAFVHRANNDETREEITNTIRAFLLVQFRAGAFRGDTPGSSYFVDASEEINPPTEVSLGRLNVRVGLATNRPAEFIILKFSQDLRDLQAELAASA